MQKKPSNELQEKHAFLADAVKRLGEFISVEENSVPPLMRNYALLHRLSQTYRPLFQYLCLSTDLPQDFEQSNIEKVVDYFIHKKAFSRKDENLFLGLSLISALMRIPQPGFRYDIECLASNTPQLYEFLTRIVNKERSSEDSWWHFFSR